VINNAGFTPSKAFLTSGVGRHKEKLTSFELALREAKIEKYNLVRVSSIFPPNCELVAADEGSALLNPGQIVFSVIAEAATNELSRLATASIGLARPADRSHYGYISEHHSFGETIEFAGDYSEDLAASMLATVLGVDFDPDEAWDERKEQWLLSGEIVETTHVGCSAEADASGQWLTVVAACVFCQ
jgi:arginine decarboxylase